MPGLTKQEIDALTLQGTPPFGFLFGGTVLRPASGLTAVAEAGLVRLQRAANSPDFTEIALAPSSRAYTASRDTYVYLTNAGALAFAEVANGGVKPTLQTLNNPLGQFVALVVTDGSNVTSVLDLRQMAGGAFDVLPFVSSFVTATQGAIDIPLPMQCRLVGLVGTVNAALGATDAGTITPARLQNGVATTIAGGALSFAASAAVGVRVTATPTVATNPILPAGSYLRVTSAKTTTGGSVAGFAVVEKI